MRRTSLRKLGAERANRRDAHKIPWVRSFPFPSFPCLPLSFFLLSLFPHILPATAKESVGALKLVSRSGRSPAAKRHIMNFGLEECFYGEGNFSYNHIIHLFTIRLLTAQSAAPAGGRPVRPHHLAPPSRRHWR